MNRTDITKKIAERIGDPQAARAAMEVMVEEVTRGLVEGDRVHISGLGSLRGKKVPRRRVRNPRTGEKVWSPKTGHVRFDAGALLKEQIATGKVKRKKAAAKKTAAAKTTSKAAAKPKAAAKKAAPKKAAAKKK